MPKTNAEQVQAILEHVERDLAKSPDWKDLQTWLDLEECFYGKDGEANKIPARCLKLFKKDLFTPDRDGYLPDRSSSNDEGGW